MEVSTIWISPTYKVAVAFGFLALVLLIRPRGLFAK
jgi:branched-subunit amino acid ABC-type transport system permease component